MAYTNFTPATRIQEAQDAMGFKIWDDSTWNGEEAITTDCYVSIFHVDDDENTIQYDDYPLINGADKTKFNEYLSIDGHIINTSDLTIDGAAAPERFEDGYYVIRVVYTDGTYSTGSEPYYDNVQAFLAKYRCMKRKMPAAVMTWPLGDEEFKIHQDIFLLGLYLEAAENAVDLSKKEQFREFIALIRAMFDYYNTENCW